MICLIEMKQNNQNNLLHWGLVSMMFKTRVVKLHRVIFKIYGIKLHQLRVILPMIT